MGDHLKTVTHRASIWREKTNDTNAW